MKKLKNLIVFFVLVLAIFIPTNINANSKIDALQQKIKENKAEKARITAEKQKLNAEANSTAKEITKLDLQMHEMDLQIEGIELEIEELNSLIAANDVAIEELEQRIDENNTLLEQRLRASYKRGDVGYLEIILNSKNIVEALTRMDLIQLIVKDDIDLLGEIRIQKSNIEELKIMQENNKNKSEEKKLELIASKEGLAKKQKEKEVYMANINKDIAEAKKAEEELEKLDKELNRDLNKLMSESDYVGGIMAYPLPIEHQRITSGFGPRPHPVYGYSSVHRGTDIACPVGTDVYAANAGKVIIATRHSQFGNYIVIDHGGKIATLYAHNSKLLVKVGDEVTRGQLIAKSGNTGMTTGPHLHFEVRENGVSVNALPYLKKQN